MTCAQILAELKTMGNENTKRVLMNHGGPASMYGVKIEDLKKIQKKIKKDYALSLQLYENKGVAE